MRMAAIHGKRVASVLILGGAGGILAAAEWAGGDHGLALATLAFYVVAVAVAYVWSGGSGDVAAILRVGGDERQRSIDHGATAVAGLVLGLTCFVATIVDLATGGDGYPFGWLCAVGGASYAIALAWIKRRS
jgi:hypothetical protein